MGEKQAPLPPDGQPRRSRFRRLRRHLSATLEANKGGIEVWKDLTILVQSLATVVGLAFAGYWTYTLFVEQRQGNPRLKLDHKISQRKLSSGDTLLSVDDLLVNSGLVRVALRRGWTRIVQVLPLPAGVPVCPPPNLALPDMEREPGIWWVKQKKEWNWAAGDEVLEPGEDEQLHSDFILPSWLATVAVVTEVSNPGNEDLSWQHLTLFDLKSGADVTSLPACPPAASSKVTNQPE